MQDVNQGNSAVLQTGGQNWCAQRTTFHIGKVKFPHYRYQNLNIDPWYNWVTSIWALLPSLVRRNYDYPAISNGPHYRYQNLNLSPWYKLYNRKTNWVMPVWALLPSLVRRNDAYPAISNGSHIAPHAKFCHSPWREGKKFLKVKHIFKALWEVF